MRRSELNEAVRAGNSGLVLEILRDSELNVDGLDIRGNPPLALAVKYKHKKIVEYLLSAGADPNILDEHGRYPLMLAAERNALKIAFVLIKSDAEIDAMDEFGRTALSYAVRAGHEQMVSLLVQNGAKTDLADHQGHSPLTQAILSNQPETAKLLMYAGAELSENDLAEDAAIQSAAGQGDVEFMEALLKRGADVNTPDLSGKTPLMVAAAVSDDDLVGALISEDADLNAQDENGVSALMIAAARGNSGMVDKMVNSGAQVDLADADGNTALQLVAASNHDGTASGAVQRTFAAIKDEAESSEVGHDGDVLGADLVGSADEVSQSVIEFLESLEDESETAAEPGVQVDLSADSFTDALAVNKTEREEQKGFGKTTAMRVAADRAMTSTEQFRQKLSEAVTRIGGEVRAEITSTLVQGITQMISDGEMQVSGGSVRQENDSEASSFGQLKVQQIGADALPISFDCTPLAQYIAGQNLNHEQVCQLIRGVTDSIVDRELLRLQSDADFINEGEFVPGEGVSEVSPEMITRLKAKIVGEIDQESVVRKVIYNVTEQIKSDVLGTVAADKFKWKEVHRVKQDEPVPDDGSSTVQRISGSAEQESDSWNDLRGQGSMDPLTPQEEYGRGGIRSSDQLKEGRRQSEFNDLQAATSREVFDFYKEKKMWGLEKRDYSEVSSRLFDYGADIGHRNNNGQTALELACASGGDATETLIKKSIESGQLDATREDLFLLAGKNNQTEVVEMLLENGVIPPKELFQSESERASFQEQFASEQARKKREKLNAHEWAARIVEAAGKSDVEQLLSRKGRPPASAPISADRKKALAGSKNAKAESGKTNLAKQDKRNAKGQTALMVAAGQGNARAISQALMAGSDASAQDPAGFSCLHYAVMSGDISAVDQLVQAGAALESVSKSGLTPFMLACSDGKAAIAEALLQAGAKADCQIKDVSILMIAAAKGHAEIVDLLLTTNVNIFHRDYRGRRASDYAKRKEHDELARRLRKRETKF